eukprot:1256644-Alexandrium_andersonii.AAC.1
MAPDSTLEHRCGGPGFNPRSTSAPQSSRMCSQKPVSKTPRMKLGRSGGRPVRAPRLHRRRLEAAVTGASEPSPERSW